MRLDSSPGYIHRWHLFGDARTKQVHERAEVVQAKGEASQEVLQLQLNAMGSLPVLFHCEGYCLSCGFASYHNLTGAAPKRFPIVIAINRLDIETAS